MNEDEAVGWHHRLNGDESEQTPGDSEGQGSPVCCRPRGRRVGHDRATDPQHSMCNFKCPENEIMWFLYDINRNYSDIKKQIAILKAQLIL